MDDLSTRVAALERQAHRSRVLAVVLGVALIAIMGVWAASMLQNEELVQDVVRTKSFELVNDRGAIVVMASADKAGNGWLSVGSGQERLAFLAQGVVKDGAPGQLRVYGPIKVMSTKEKNLVYAGPADGGLGLLKVSNEDGEHLITVAGTPSGGGLQVFNENGERVVTLGVDDSGIGEVTVWDTAGGGRKLSPRD